MTTPIAEAQDNMTIRSDSMISAAEPSQPQPKQKWKPYHSLNSAKMRKLKLDEALRKIMGGTAHNKADIPSPNAAPKPINALTAPNLPPNHPYHGIPPRNRAKWFNSLPSYRSNSTLAPSKFNLRRRSTFDHDEDIQDLLSPSGTRLNAVWENGKMVPACDTPPLPLPLRRPRVESTEPRPEIPVLQLETKGHTICAGVRSTWDRFATKTKIPVPTTFKMKTGSWGRERQRLEFDILNSRRQQENKVRMVLSDCTFQDVQREGGDGGLAQERTMGREEIRDETRKSSTRVPTPVGHDEGSERAAGLSRTIPSTPARTDSNTRPTLESNRRSNTTTIESRLPTLSHRRRAPDSGVLLGPTRLSNTIHRAPNSIRSTPTPTPTSPPPHSPTLSELLRTTSLEDTPLTPNEAIHIRTLMHEVTRDTEQHRHNTSTNLHVARNETLEETTAKVRQRLQKADEEASRQVRREQERRIAARTLPRQKSAYMPQRQESLKPSGLRQVAFIEPVDMRFMPDFPIDDPYTMLEDIESSPSQRQEGNGTSPTVSPLGTPNTSPLPVDGSVVQNDSDSENESREERLRRARKGKAPDRRAR
ncbi:hypothetical protein CC86DRAFT_387998 [Ophiobolus disseminans]|uniref:Uncharacterized protein n=1 Tax=Ophiobolus disseminans TaxID=1469910 RepID=A0A6A6ZHA0_9PLEO|nr:hypothetical protein CC86DRAFT_387998 [Ophiobolus disseminans]